MSYLLFLGHVHCIMLLKSVISETAHMSFVLITYLSKEGSDCFTLSMDIHVDIDPEHIVDPEFR